MKDEEESYAGHFILIIGLFIFCESITDVLAGVL